MQTVQLVWFKRDLRVADHQPLAQAAKLGTVLPLYVFEPDLWRQPEMDPTHFQFVCQSLQELGRGLNDLGIRFHSFTGDVVEVLRGLQSHVAIASVHSHEETGGKWTYDRDLRVKAWLQARGIPWFEYPQNGVVRGLRNRDRWAATWKERMSQPIAPTPARIEGFVPKSTTPLPDTPLPEANDLQLSFSNDVECQIGGESQAAATLNSFLETRGSQYRSAMSSPITAQEQCSRLSPYIAWGCITIKQVYQAVRAKQMGIAEAKNMGVTSSPAFTRSLSSFQSRLSWHCHFIQKLDDEPELEFRNLCRAYDGMREDDFRSDHFEQWCRGLTGYPMIDACMRYLHRHRWINFRMRAMLMSFAAYHLWLHWREPALFLAKSFLDFEPGIHFPQVQMQSGVTGINAVRIYSPVKQAMDQDPNGEFVRRWIPELEHVPKPFIFEPWKMSIDDQTRYRCRIGVDYPVPIVDHRTAVASAKDRIYLLRRSEQAIFGAQQVYEKHGSRKNRDPLPKKRPRSSPESQLWLPGMEE